MRILHVYKDYAPVVGGIENHIRTLAESHSAQGHEVTVLVTGPDQRTEERVEHGVRIVRAGRLLTVASAPISIALVAALRRLRPDITHLHSPYPVGEAAWLSVGRSPMVLTYHSDVVRQRLLGALWAPGLRRVLARADRILATSPPYVESSPFLREARDRVTVVPLGIDPNRFESTDRDTARARYGPGPNLVFVGRLRYYKGLDVLIDALVDLPGVNLLVVGVGPMAGTWYARAIRQGVDQQITWLGHVSDDHLQDVLAAGDIYVLPATARSEALGIAVLEGMAAGLPVVSTELGTGTSWVNQAGVTGRVVPPRDPAALANAIRALVDDEPTRQAMGEAARERVRRNFTAAQMIEHVERIYGEVSA